MRRHPGRISAWPAQMLAFGYMKGCLDGLKIPYARSRLALHSATPRRVFSLILDKRQRPLRLSCTAQHSR
jgi:hypothetical protein